MIIMNKKQLTIYTYENLYKKIEKFITNKNERELIQKAYEFANKKHGTRNRLNGDSYISHPLSVAYILGDLNVDYVTIVGALLHETVNHANTTIEEIEEEFGQEVAKIVKSISKINKLELIPLISLSKINSTLKFL